MENYKFPVDRLKTKLEGRLNNIIDIENHMRNFLNIDIKK